jgi:hypothetical protein
MTGANAGSDAREQRQNMLVHTRESVQVDRFEGFDKQNDFRRVREFNFSAASIMVTMSELTKAYRLCPLPSRG